MSLASLPRRARIMIVGEPKQGKTGALACLANAGFNIRILDFDNNLDPLIAFCTPEGLARIDVVTLEDRLKDGERVIEPSGVPASFGRALKMIREWKHTLPDGTEVNLGPVKSWGLNDVLVVDSLTQVGEAAMRRTLSVNNRTSETRELKHFGTAAGDQDAMMQIVTAGDIPCHVIVLAHLTIIGPKVDAAGKNDTELTIAAKEAKAAVAELIQPKYFPNAVGYKLPQNIAGHFPTVLLAETEVVNGKVKRVLRTQPKPEITCIGVPAKDLPVTLPQDTGLLTVFKAITGHPFTTAPAAAAKAA